MKISICNFKVFVQLVKKDNVSVAVNRIYYGYYAYAYLNNGELIYTRTYKDLSYLMRFVEREFGDNYKI